MEPDLFDAKPLNEHQAQSIQLVKDEARRLQSVVTDLVPEGRYRALCITHLEQLVLWANKGISRGD